MFHRIDAFLEIPTQVLPEGQVDFRVRVRDNFTHSLNNFENGVITQNCYIFKYLKCK